jgi:hypothetical protein
MASTVFSPPTPSRKTLPSSSTTSPYHTVTYSSTPNKAARSSVERGGSSCGTHESVDRFVLSELNGRVLADVGDFFERWIAPSEQEREMFIELVNGVLAGVETASKWAMPKTYSDQVYLPWVGKRMRETCESACKWLADGGDDAFQRRMEELTVVESKETRTARDHETGRIWMERLDNRTWATKPGNMTGASGTRAVDIVLTATPASSDRWDTVLVVGEHKSKATLGERKAATAQLAGYTGEIFGVQPFRHVIPGYTLLQDQIQLWMCDRMGCFGSKVFNISTDDPETRRRFVEITLAFALMDYIAPGFDPDVYCDVACTTM